MPRPRRLLAVAAAALTTLAATAACGATERADQSAEPQVDQRVITHARGETPVSADPKRVVVLDTGELDNVLALGIKPVGAVAPDATNSLPPYLAEKAEGVPIVGTIGSPNLEQIATLKPDLILGSNTRDGQKYDQLNAIAPTVFSDTVGKTWKDNFLLNADALNKKPDAERTLADYRKRATDIGRQVGDPGRVEVSMLRLTSGQMRLYGAGSFIGTVLADAGFSRPANQRLDDTFLKISREQLSQADGDLLFYSSYGSTTQQRLDELVNGRMWRNLDAVRNGRAIEVADDSWFLGLGPLGANRVLDDLQKFLPRT